MSDEESTTVESPGVPAQEEGADPNPPAPSVDGDVPPGQGADVPAAGTPSRAVPWLATLALIGLALLAGMETAGLLLRDSLERRQAPLAEAPAVIGEAEGDAAATATPGARFGPGVKEVAVAAADTSRPAAAKPVAPPQMRSPDAQPQVPATAKQPPTEPGAKATEPPTAVVSQPAGTPEVPPAPRPEPSVTAHASTGTHALQVGIFGSQKYRHAMERQLEKEGLPHFRSQRSKQGEGYRLALPLTGAGQRDRAQEVLDSAGVVYTLQADSLEAVFHFEAEAQRALQKLSDAGLSGGYGATKGEIPLWVVYAGPFPLDEAKSVRQQLAILGLPSYLRKAP